MGLHTKKIVITGGPATGKTSLIDLLKLQGHHCFPEIIREFTIEETENKDTKELASNPIVFADDSLAFNKRLLEGRKAHYQASLQLENDLIFFDRGIPDVLAYMDFFNQSYGKEFINVCKNAPYDAVFILPPWKEIFESDGERYETFEEASKLHNNLIERYTFFGTPPVEVPKDTIENRVNYIIKSLSKII